MSDQRAALAEAYDECEKLAKSHYENFPVASWLLPSAMRPHIAALYAFARVADDIADEGTAAPEMRRSRLDHWLAGLHQAAAGDKRAAETLHSSALIERSPGDVCERDARILMAAGHSIRSLDLPITLFDDLVDAFGQDIMTTRYDSWRDVLDYCRRSANPVGRLVLRIAGYRDERLDHSSDALCTALQLTNFWQDLGRDWRIGRLYVPAEVTRAVHASEAALDGPQLTAEWVRAIEACVSFTLKRFADGREVCDGVGGRLRAELRLTWLGGQRMLERVHHDRFNLLHHRPTLGMRDVPVLLWRAFFWRRRTRSRGSRARVHA